MLLRAAHGLARVYRMALVVAVRLRPLLGVAMMSVSASDDVAGFADLALRPELLRALSDLGYEEPTPIQGEAIPPLLQRLPEQGRGAVPSALVLVPTRELAVQVSQAFHRYGRDLGVRVLPIYGGQPIGRQLQALERGVDVVVATPGRAL